MKTKRNAIFKTLCDELHLSRDEVPDECLEEMFPFCKGCCEKVEKLWEYNEEIKRIQKKKEATLLDIRRTVTEGEFFQPKIRNSNPLVVKADAKKFKRLREVILKANRDALRNDSQNDDSLIDESSDRSEDIGIVTQHRKQMRAAPNGVAVVCSFKPIAAPRIIKSHSPCVTRVNNFNDQNVMDQKYCVFCAKSFPSNGSLMQHLLTHTREKPFTCNVCGMEFGQIGHLTAHIRTHTGERPFKCILCFNTFNQTSNLESHLRTHTRERPFNCNLCFKTFNQKGDLGSHLRTHTGEKPFKCSLCFKTFNQKKALRSHLRTHTGEKPFKCNLCFKTFSRKCNLGIHLRTHTRERPFKCNLCFKTFSQKGNLGSHLRTHIRK